MFVTNIIVSDEKTSKKLVNKKDCVNMKVTTRIMGSTKRKFVHDCETKEVLESQMSRAIIEVYYKIVETIPRYEYMDIPEIKKYISDKINF